MRSMKMFGFLVCALVFLAGAISPSAHADQWNQLTYFTFSGPFEIPGFHGPMVLPAGTYTFKLLDSISNRDIVQIFNKNQTHLYATILAIRDLRMKPTGKPVIRFAERVSASPEAIRAWFYPGDVYGQQFVYPKSRAAELARANREPVLSMPDETAKNMSEPAKSANESAVKAMENANVRAEEPNGQEVDVSQVVTPPPAKSASNNSNASSREGGR